MSCARGPLKKTTGIAGLAVDPAPHRTLAVLYGKILRALQKIPAEAFYRQYTEEIINGRAQVLKATTTYDQIEKRLGCGQVEELIVQAENELLLARKMLLWKPWEPLFRKAPPTQWDWPPAQPCKQA